MEPQRPDADRIVEQFHQVMGRFLETQERIMVAFLKGAAGSNGAGVVGHAGQGPEAATHTAPSFPPAPAGPATHPSNGGTRATGAAAGAEEPAAAVEATPAPASGQAPDPSRTLLDIVSERTGYPPEMLDLDANLEADLGIDSIKRVEILGAFLRACAPPDRQSGHDMETLTRARTLRAILDGCRKPPERVAPEGARPAVAAPQVSAAPVTEVARFRVTVVEAPLPPLSPAAPEVAGRVIAITDDGRGVARAVADELGRRGGRPVLVRPDEGTAPGSGLAGDLGDPAAIATLVDGLRRHHGTVHGFIHLLPLGHAGHTDIADLAGWRRRLRLEVKSLFHLAHALGGDLRHGGGWLLAATGMGGAFAADAGDRGFFPGQGGIAGLVKSLAKEWPEARCVAVDLDPGEPPAALAACLLGELGGADRAREVGYRAGRRLILRQTPAPLDIGAAPTLEIGSDSVILVTGGARGITAEVALELASRYRPTLILIGRSPAPVAQEDHDTAALQSLHTLKPALIERLRRASGRTPTPSAVENACRQLLREREMRRNLAALASTGARVRYEALDVLDHDRFAAFIESIDRDYGRLDGVIHGAGVIEDRLLLDKEAASFDRVFDTKVDSGFTLCQAVRPATLRFLVFFSSIAGRLGNRGQADYAAANEVLAKLAIRLDRTWPGRVVAVDWGPWESGMVTEDLRRQFQQQGVQVIPVAEGRRVLDRELRWGRKGEAEIIVGRTPDGW